jgi:hypothetical protein
MSKLLRQINAIVTILGHFSPLSDMNRLGSRTHIAPDIGIINRIKKDISNGVPVEDIAKQYRLITNSPVDLFKQICSMARVRIVNAKGPDPGNDVFSSDLKISQLDRGLIIRPVTKTIPEKFWLIPFHDSFYILSSIVFLVNGRLLIADLQFNESHFQDIGSLTEQQIRAGFGVSSKFKTLDPAATVEFLLYNKLFLGTQSSGSGTPLINLFSVRPQNINLLETAIVTESLDKADSVARISNKVLLNESRKVMRRFIRLFNKTMNDISMSTFQGQHFQVDLHAIRSIKTKLKQKKKISQPSDTKNTKTSKKIKNKVSVPSDTPRDTKKTKKSSETPSDTKKTKPEKEIKNSYWEGGLPEDRLKYYCDFFPDLPEKTVEEVLYTESPLEKITEEISKSILSPDSSEEEKKKFILISADSVIKKTLEQITEISSGKDDDRSMLRKLIEYLFIPETLAGKIAVGSAAVIGIGAVYYNWDKIMDVWSCGTSFDCIGQKLSNIFSFFEINLEKECSKPIEFKLDSVWNTFGNIGSALDPRLIKYTVYSFLITSIWNTFYSPTSNVFFILIPLIFNFMKFLLYLANMNVLGLGNVFDVSQLLVLLGSGSLLFFSKEIFDEIKCFFYFFTSGSLTNVGIKQAILMLLTNSVHSGKIIDIAAAAAEKTQSTFSAILRFVSGVVTGAVVGGVPGAVGGAVAGAAAAAS